MRDFNRDRRGGGGRDFKRRDFDRPQQMHTTICSNCGKECEVPFKPTGSKPVFCRECFQNNREGGVGPSNYQRRDFGDRDNDRREHSNNRPQPQANYNEQFNALNQKLDKIINLLSGKNEVKEESVHQHEPKKENALNLEGEQETVTILPPVVKKKKVVKAPKK